MGVGSNIADHASEGWLPTILGQFKFRRKWGNAPALAGEAMVPADSLVRAVAGFV